MPTTPARGRHRFPAKKRPRVSYNLGLEGFEYSHGVALSQEGGQWHVMSNTTQERFSDRASAHRRFNELVRINRDLGLG